MSNLNKILYSILFLYLLFTVGCKQKDESQVVTIDPNDKVYISFGKVFQVKDYPNIELINPHEVTAYSVWKCSQGQTKDMLSQIPHVEKDYELGKALTSFIEMSGPDLEKYRDIPLSIKFEGYWLNDDSSVWYYYLTDPNGICFPHKPWISSHRSRTTHKCALTGIFLYDPNEEQFDPLPDYIIRTKGRNK